MELFGNYDEIMEEPEIELPTEEEMEDAAWLNIAADAFRVSDNFFNSSIRKQIDRNIDQFNSRHHSGSKYNSPTYKFRSKIFRPKSRSSIRRHEAAAATAYFSSSDMVSCEAQNEDDPQARAAAQIGNRLINGRLSEPEHAWFMTCLGAYQDAMVQGVVISKQDWLYEEKADEGILGQEPEVIKDRFTCDIIPVENFRFDPNSDWRNPVESSPYLIEVIPMYRGDVKAKMANTQSEIPWRQLEDGELSSGRTETQNSTIRARNGDRQNPQDQKHEESDYDLIWVHQNIVRVDGEDVIFYTLRTEQLLSDPVPLKDVHPIGRPYTMGFCNLETHKTHPTSTVALGGGLQQEINEIANQRLDNVKLVVNRRSFVRRNAKIDLRSLTHSAPGGITLVEDVDRDVRHDAPPDVTSSSYAEQDRLNNDFDEIAGAFSGSSVASNRQLNETVGGMEIMSADASSVTDYQLRVFAETWLKPTLHQFLQLERAYESSPKRLMDASGGMQPEQALQVLQSDINVKLSVGFGATNPQKQVEKLAFGLNTLGHFLPQKIQQLDADEVTKEIFASLGFQDGKRFFEQEKGQDPQVKEMQQQIQELQQQLQQKQIESQTKIQVEQVKQQGNLQREQLRNQVNMDIAGINQDIEYINQQIDAEKNDIKRQELIIQREAYQQNKRMQELEFMRGERNHKVDYLTDKRDKMSELLMSNKYGLAPGIDDQQGRG